MCCTQSRHYAMISLASQGMACSQLTATADYNHSGSHVGGTVRANEGIEEDRIRRTECEKGGNMSRFVGMLTCKQLSGGAKYTSADGKIPS